MKRLKGLKETRTKLKVKQVDLADRVNLSQSAMSSLEAGRETVHLPYLLQIEEALGQPIDWFNGVIFTKEENIQVAEIITALAERVPMEVVLPFVTRCIRADSVEQKHKIPLLQNLVERFREIEKK